MYCRQRYANPEDLEYYDCQKELQEQLQEQYMLVERVIGK